MDDAPGRYCLAVCYCGRCPHYQPYAMTRAEWLVLCRCLAHPPRKHTPSWWADPSGQAGQRT